MVESPQLIFNKTILSQIKDNVELSDIVKTIEIQYSSNNYYKVIQEFAHQTLKLDLVTLPVDYNRKTLFKPCFKDENGELEWISNDCSLNEAYRILAKELLYRIQAKWHLISNNYN